MHKEDIKDDKRFIAFLKDQATRDWLPGDLGSDFLSEGNKNRHIKSYNDLHGHLKSKRVSPEVIKALEVSLKEYKLFKDNKNNLKLSDIKTIYQKIHAIETNLRSIHNILNQKNIVTGKYDLDTIKMVKDLSDKASLLNVTFQDLAYNKVEGFTDKIHHSFKKREKA